MDRCSFPEKLFEAMVNYELFAMYKKKGEKIDLWSPSQSKEASLGYDALFTDKGGLKKKKIVAIQYKVPTYQYKTTNTKKNIKEGDLKFYLHKNKKGEYKQHDILLKLVKSKTIDKVQYCAPLFLGSKQLNNFTRSGTLQLHCAFIDLRPLPPSKTHFCTYNETDCPVFHSENFINSKLKTMKDVFDEDSFESQSDISDKERAKKLKDFLDKYGEELMGVTFYSF